MKKRTRKLSLNRETLFYLGSVTGGITVARTCTGTDQCGSPTDGGSDSYATCGFNTCGVCSGGCATGGACTV